jgi:hypothetical protein
VGSTPTWATDEYGPFDFWRGRRLLTPARGDRNPYGLLPIPGSSNGRTAGSEPAGVGSTPTPGTRNASVVKRTHHGSVLTSRSRFDSWPGYCPTASVVKRTSRGSAKSEVLVRLRAEALWPNPKRQREPAVNRLCVGSTPTGHPNTPAMLDRPGTALVTRTKWVRVPPLALTDSGVAQSEEHLAETEGAAGSTPAAGTDLSGSGPLAGHGFREPGEAGSIPASLTAGTCPHRLSRSTTVVRPAVNRTGAGSSPAGTARYGRASRLATAPGWKPGEAKALAGSTPVPSARW